MTARVLVVDDILANVRLLEAKLTAEYFEVATAMSGMDALEIIQRKPPDIVLLDIMMPGIDGIEVCKRIKANPATTHIPVIMVTALDQPEDRVRGLEAGADDFLTKPVNDLALFCRVKSLVRLKMLTDELRARSVSGEFVGLGGTAQMRPLSPGKVLVVDSRAAVADRVRSALAGHHDVTAILSPQEAIVNASATAYELIIVSLDLEHFDPLRLCSQLKSLEKTRQVPILLICDPGENQKLMRALDMGVNDYLMRPIDKGELLARANTQIKRWRYTEQLRNNVQATIEMAVTDGLTGLFNRRYMETQLRSLADHAVHRGRNLSVITLDVDFFKMVNDNHGHDVGDRVLQELAARCKRNVRSVDIVCRMGGEEFLVILPETNMDLASRIAERLRKAVSSKPFNAGARSGFLNITVSLGVATLDGIRDGYMDLLKRSDQALYRAKQDGRNRTVCAAA